MFDNEKKSNKKIAIGIIILIIYLIYYLNSREAKIIKIVVWGIIIYLLYYLYDILGSADSKNKSIFESPNKVFNTNYNNNFSKNNYSYNDMPLFSNNVVNERNSLTANNNNILSDILNKDSLKNINDENIDDNNKLIENIEAYKTEKYLNSFRGSNSKITNNTNNNYYNNMIFNLNPLENNIRNTTFYNQSMSINYKSKYNNTKTPSKMNTKDFNKASTSKYQINNKHSISKNSVISKMMDNNNNNLNTLDSNISNLDSTLKILNINNLSALNSNIKNTINFLFFDFIPYIIDINRNNIKKIEEILEDNCIVLSDYYIIFEPNSNKLDQNKLPLDHLFNNTGLLKKFKRYEELTKLLTIRKKMDVILFESHDNIYNSSNNRVSVLKRLIELEKYNYNNNYNGYNIDNPKKYNSNSDANIILYIFVKYIYYNNNYYLNYPSNKIFLKEIGNKINFNKGFYICLDSCYYNSNKMEAINGSEKLFYIIFYFLHYIKKYHSEFINEKCNLDTNRINPIHTFINNIK